MRLVLVFVSPNGTTKDSTKILEESIIKDGHEIDIFDIGSTLYRENNDLIFQALEGADVVGFGSPIYEMDILQPMKNILRGIKYNSGKFNYKFKCFIYLNYAGITSGKAFINSVKILRESKVPIIGGVKISAPHFHQDKEFPSTENKKTIEDFYERIKSNNYAEIEGIELDRIFSPEKLLVNVLYPFVHLIGKKRKPPIEIKSEKCKTCYKCANECPMGAINIDSTINIDSHKCIYCYHCTIACHFGAIETSIERLDDMIELNKRIIGVECPQDKVYM